MLNVDDAGRVSVRGQDADSGGGEEELKKREEEERARTSAN
jgi:hypothetical protein